MDRDIVSRRRLLALAAAWMGFTSTLRNLAAVLIVMMEAEILLWTARREYTPRIPRRFSRVNAVTDMLYNLSGDQFRRRMRMSPGVFRYILEHFEGHSMWTTEWVRKYTALGPEEVLAIGLDRLSSGASYEVVARLNRITKSAAWSAFQVFLWAMKIGLRAKFVQWPESAGRKELLEEEFRALKGFPGIVGAIDGSHIPIMRPVRYGVKDFYNRKQAASVLLQGICSARGLFWDYHCGWAGSLHDYGLFKKTPAGKRIRRGALDGYMLVGDAAYPPRPFMISPYKEGSLPLSREQRQFNYYLSVTRIAIERTFGALKVRWRVLMSRVHADLARIPEMVGVCVVLHNICETLDGPVQRAEIREAEQEARQLGRNFYARWHAHHFEALNVAFQEHQGAPNIMLPDVQGASAEEVPVERDSNVDLNAEKKLGYEWRDWLLPLILEFNK